MDEDRDEPLGEMVGRLLDDGKGYARAEINLARVRVETIAMSYRDAVLLGAGAAIFALVALIMLFTTIAQSLTTLIGPLAGGAVTTLLAAGTAAGLAAVAKRKLETAND